MDLTLTHSTTYEYDPAPGGAALRLRLFPPQTNAQHVSRWMVTINGTPVTPLHTDVTGDAVALWQHQGTVDKVEIIAAGRIITKDTSGIHKSAAPDMPALVYLRETELTAPNAGIQDLAAKAGEGEVLERLHKLSPGPNGGIGGSHSVAGRA